MVLDTVSSINGVPIRVTDERWEQFVDARPYMQPYYGTLLDTIELLAEERLASFLEELEQYISLPGEPKWSRYDEEADVVYVGFTEKGGATRSDELNDYVILDYRGDDLVGIEILNASLHV